MSKVVEHHRIAVQVAIAAVSCVHGAWGQAWPLLTLLTNYGAASGEQIAGAAEIRKAAHEVDEALVNLAALLRGPL